LDGRVKQYVGTDPPTGQVPPRSPHRGGGNGRRPAPLGLASVVVVHRRARVVKHTRSRGAGARLQEWPVTAPGLRRTPARCGPNGGFYLALGRSVTREGPSAPG